MRIHSVISVTQLKPAIKNNLYAHTAKMNSPSVENEASTENTTDNDVETALS